MILLPSFPLNYCGNLGFKVHSFSTQSPGKQSLYNGVSINQVAVCGGSLRLACWRVYKYNSVPGDEGFMEFFSLHVHLFQLQYALLFADRKNFF